MFPESLFSCRPELLFGSTGIHNDAQRAEFIVIDDNPLDRYSLSIFGDRFIHCTGHSHNLLRQENLIAAMKVLKIPHDTPSPVTNRTNVNVSGELREIDVPTITTPVELKESSASSSHYAVARTEIKTADITNKYRWVGRLINIGLIKEDKVCAYPENTLQALNYWGVYMLMKGKSPELTLDKALTLSSDETRVFDIHDAYHEIIWKQSSIDEVIRKYRTYINKVESYSRPSYDNPEEEKRYSRIRTSL